MRTNYNSINDYVLDESFQKWVLRQDHLSIRIWEEYIRQNSNQLPVIEKARSIILGFQVENNTLDEAYIDEKYIQLSEKIKGKRVEVGIFSKLHKYAAVIAIILVAISAFWVSQPKYDIAITTAYGEIKTVTLPDGSDVTLNGNSRLYYNKNWQQKGIREVWLEGEAYFSVQKHPAAYPKFFVHCSDIDVEVTGTKFNVNNRSDKQSVVLDEGGVTILVNEDENLRLNPGEMVVYDLEKLGLKKYQVETKKFNSWREGRLIFEQTPLSEIASILANTYGLQVELSPSLKQKELSGTIPSGNLEVLLLAIEKSFELKIIQKNNQIKITK